MTTTTLKDAVRRILDRSEIADLTDELRRGLQKLESTIRVYADQPAIDHLREVERWVAVLCDRFQRPEPSPIKPAGKTYAPIITIGGYSAPSTVRHDWYSVNPPLPDLTAELGRVRAILSHQPEPCSQGNESPRDHTGPDPQGLYSPADLARLFGLGQDALEKRLARWRKGHFEGWIENRERRPTEPQFLYRLSVVQPIVDAMLASRETSRKRPAKQNPRT